MDMPSENLRALELYHQLENLSPAGNGNALLVTVRFPNGQYVGAVRLSCALQPGMSVTCTVLPLGGRVPV
jgi:hypothetical protein